MRDILYMFGITFSATAGMCVGVGLFIFVLAMSAEEIRDAVRGGDSAVMGGCGD